MGNLGATEIILICLVVALLYMGFKLPKYVMPSTPEFQPCQGHNIKTIQIPFNDFLDSALLGRDLLLQDSSFAKKRGTSYEALLFTSAYIMMRFKQLKPSLYTEFRTGFSKEIYNYTIKQNITEYLPGGFSNFFEQRLNSNSEEINLLLSTQKRGFIPLQSVVYNLYEKPLTTESYISHNLPASLELLNKFPHVSEFLNKAIELIIAEKNL